MDYYTIPNFTNMTKQELFDMSARHILTTRQASRNADGACIYGGSGCGAAPFLREEVHADADKYTTSWGQLRYKEVVPEHECEFVSSLQRAHDQAACWTDSFVNRWKESMVRVAAAHKLSTDVIDHDKQP